MKTLYFGTICNSKSYKKLLTSASVKPSAAPFVFESALMQGFREHGADIEVFSFPVIPAFPRSSTIFVKSIKNKLDCGYPSSWIPSLNIIGLKQLTQKISSRRMLKKWLRENSGEEKAVLTYSLYQPIAKSIVSLCRRYKTPCFGIVPDLPRDMYANIHLSPLKRFFTGIYLKKAVKIQDKFDGYIYLTKQMKEEINPSAPYIVVEGIADPSDFDFPSLPKKKDFRTIMYAGTLNEKMGIKKLLSAFSQIEDKNITLRIFGDGDSRDAVIAATKRDNRIKYWGFKPRSEILRHETEADLLVNLRDPGEKYTAYSFPSKTLEYMLSGTPLLTTKLRGIPDEYYKYVFTPEDYTVNAISGKIKEILAMTDEERLDFGLKAKKFVSENKNSFVQSGKILEFITAHIKKEAPNEYKA